MKRNIIFAALFLLIAVPVFASDNPKNKLMLGADVTGEALPDEEEPRLLFAPSIAYEMLFCDFTQGCLTGEASLCVNPFQDICSLSVAIKCYSDKMTGWFVGVLPLSDLNFYSLFNKNQRFQYGIGIEFGRDFVLSHNLDCGVKANPGLIFQDSAVIVKMTIALNVGYRF